MRNETSRSPDRASSRTGEKRPRSGRGGPAALLASDTSAEAERIQIDLWRRMAPIEKARAVSGISRVAQELSLAGIRLRHPRASERECLLRLAMLKLGRDLTLRAYPDAATLLGS